MKLNKKQRYTFLVRFAFFVMSAMLLNIGTYGQETEKVLVNGVIIDNAGQPLPGASIIVEGTTIGTMTDVNGAFTLSTFKGKIVKMSFVGYKSQKITASSSEKLSIKLEEDFITLGEATIVVVGYGTMRKSDLTGAIASVSADDFKKGVVTSSEQLLQGKVAGLTVIQGSGDPSQGASVRLRGGTSLTASNSPLYVVDGIPGVDINSIQPSEISSIDVLKDASSAAIYGSRGANGVIIVTTNRARKGKSLEYSGYVAVGSVAHHLDLLSANQWRKYVRDNSIANAVDYGGNTDWQAELEQTSIAQSHSITYNSATEDGGYHIALNYLKNDGVIKKTYLERMGISASAFQFALKNKLRLEAGVNTNFDKWSVIDNRIFLRSYNLNPTIPVRDENNNFSNVPGTLYENPVEINTNRTSEDTRHRLLGYGKAEYEIIKGLKAVVNISYEYNSHQSGLYKPTYAVMEGKSSVGFGQKSLGDYRNAQLESYLTYNKEIGSHKLNILGGYSYLDYMYDGFGALRQGFNTDLFSYNNLGAGYDAQAGDVYSYKGNSKLISYYGRVNYSFMGRYMFTGTLREDGSSRFGANNKWGLFPSASVAWRISDENFMKGAGWLNNVKLRLGYGVAGNQDGIGDYKSFYIYGTSSPSSTGGTVSVPYFDAQSKQWKLSYGPSQNANPDLKWESTATTNVGLDFGLFNRVNGTIEIYQKKTSDLLYTYNVPVPPYLVGVQLANVGDLTNKGIEISLNANIIKTKDFSWDVNVNASHNVQKVVKLSNDAFKLSDSSKPQAVELGSLNGLTGMTGVFTQTLREGYPVGTFWGRTYQGLDENGNYILGPDTTNLGNVQPKLNLGLSMNFTYKQFDLGISTYGMFGQKVLNASDMIMYDGTRLPIYNVPDDFLNSGIGKNQPPAYSSYWIQDASFFRLQSISLGYNFSIKKIGIEKLRFYVTGENLFVITKYKGVDPEISIEGLNSPGIDMNNYYPKPRTFSFGVNVSF